MTDPIREAFDDLYSRFVYKPDVEDTWRVLPDKGMVEGDCDDFALTLVRRLQAEGLDARFVLVKWRKASNMVFLGDGWHAACEVECWERGKPARLKHWFLDCNLHKPIEAHNYIEYVTKIIPVPEEHIQEKAPPAEASGAKFRSE